MTTNTLKINHLAATRTGIKYIHEGKVGFIPAARVTIPQGSFTVYYEPVLFNYELRKRYGANSYYEPIQRYSFGTSKSGVKVIFEQEVDTNYDRETNYIGEEAWSIVGNLTLTKQRNDLYTKTIFKGGGLTQTSHDLDTGITSGGSVNIPIGSVDVMTTDQTQKNLKLNLSINAKHQFSEDLKSVLQDLWRPDAGYFTQPHWGPYYEFFPKISDTYDCILGTPNEDKLSGDRPLKLPDDCIDGLSEDDILNGLTGSDKLIGGNGKDKLVGGEGNDTLVGVGPALGRKEIDTLVGGAGKDIFVLGTNQSIHYDDGRQSNGVPAASASTFGLVKRVSGTGWRTGSDVDARPGRTGSNFHFGVDYGSERKPMPFKAGIAGEVVRTGGEFNTISIQLPGNPSTFVDYLHASKILVKANQEVGPKTILGKTGGTGPKGVNQYATHLHVQARDASGRLLDPDAVFAGAANLTPEKWCQGVGDYAIIKDFTKTEDIIQLNGRARNYYLQYFELGQSIVNKNIIPSGTAIIYENDGVPGLSKRDELIGVVAGQNISNFNAGFSFI